MADKALLGKLADIPLAKPGFDALGMTAPVLMKMNPDGNWEHKPPGNLDEDRLKAIVQYLVKSQAVSAAQSYCTECCADSQRSGGKSNYVPVIMMPILPADQCPFDMECEVQKMKEKEGKETQKAKKEIVSVSKAKDSGGVTKPKKRGYVMQRLNDFDLLSQW